MLGQWLFSMPSLAVQMISHALLTAPDGILSMEPMCYEKENRLMRLVEEILLYNFHVLLHFFLYDFLFNFNSLV